MAFAKGHKKVGGKKKGTPNKLTRTVRETLMQVFNELQDDPKVNLLAFGRKYPRDFYALAAKLIPVEITGQVEHTIKGIEEIEIVHTTK